MHLFVLLIAGAGLLLGCHTAWRSAMHNDAINSSALIRIGQEVVEQRHVSDNGSMCCARIGLLSRSIMNAP
jgi:hypothetical protein